MPSMFLAHAFQRQLEHDFVVVHWDRRGAGKSFDAARDPGSLTVGRTLEDTFELSRLLRKRFGHERIYLVAHSWGTYLGLLAVREHPEYYAAYVGMGQLAGTRTQVEESRHELLLREVAQAGDERLLHRLKTGKYHVTEEDLFRYGGELYGARSYWPILRAGLLAPEYTLWDALNVKRGAALVERTMRYDVLPRPLEGEISELAVPVFLFLGRHDYNTPSSLAAAYLGHLVCPLKEVVWFEHSAHFPFFEEAERFRAEMAHVEATTRAFWRNRGESL